ncbi:Uncharacterised protein [uncultured archaeon]|nr:Uncharacterised protein [uncultured archaeon]
MGTSVIGQSEAVEIKRFLGSGLQPLDRGVPPNYAENPCYCAFLLDGSCEGAKDPEYKTRCRSENFGYLNCQLYSYCQERANNSSEKLHVSDPLSDTVVISAEDVLSMRRSHRSKVDDSIHDRVAEGESDRKFGYLRRSLGSVEW